MSDTVMFIPDPEDRNPPPIGIGAAYGEEIDTLNSDVKELEALESEIAALYQAHTSITHYGIDKSAFSLMQKRGLLDDTALSSLGLESIVPEPIAGPIAGLALEVLAEKADEKTTQWGVKILNTIKKGIDLITGKVKLLWEKVETSAKALADMTWDATKVAGTTIKAHPYKTVLAVLAAAAVGFGIFTFVATGIPTGVVTNGAMLAFMSRLQGMYNKVKTPFGKVTTTIVDGGRIVLGHIEKIPAAAQSASAATLGWSKAAFEAVLKQSESVFKGVSGGAKYMWENVIKPAEKVLATILMAPKDLNKYVTEKTGMRSAGWAAEKITSATYYAILYKLLNNVYSFVKDLVSKALQTVQETFQSLKSALA